MTALVWVLIVIGMLFVLGSFFVTEKLSSSDIEKIKEVTENEVKMILQAELDKADDKIRENMDEKMQLALDRGETVIEKQATETLMSISELSDTYLKSVNDSHSEIMFMYNALNDKQEELTQLTKDVQLLQSAVTVEKKELLGKADKLEKAMAQIEEDKKVLELKKKELDDQLAEALKTAKDNEKTAIENEEIAKELKAKEDEVKQLEAKLAAEPVSNLPKVEDPESFLPQKEGGHMGRKDDILALHKEGKTVVEIAKELGLGLGEVKLVIDLNTKKKSTKKVKA